MKKMRKLLLYILIGAVGIWLTLKLLLPIGLPFLLGWGISRLAMPLARKLEGRIPCVTFVSVTCALIPVGGLLFALGWGAYAGLQQLSARLPSLLHGLSELLSGLHSTLLRLAERLPDGLSGTAAQWLDELFAGSSLLAGTVSEWLVSLAGKTLLALPELLLFALTAVLSAYLFSAERKRISERIERFLPSELCVRGKNLLRKLISAVGAYLKTQVRLSGVILIMTAVGLLVLGRRDAPAMALLIAAVDVLPVFGAGTVLIPWGIVALLRGDTTFGIGVLVLYLLCTLGRSFLEPRFLGKQIGLSPLLTLVALYSGYRLFGILGMLLLPVAVLLLKTLYELFEPA